LIAHYRALGKRYEIDDEWMFWYPLSTLHQTPWEAPSPKGYYDDTPIWLNPDGSRIRLDIAQASSEWYRPGYTGNAVGLAQQLFDRALTGATRNRIETAQNDTTNWSAKNDALTILLSSPEFQRR
jgi:uncharacterized protein (DUF1800 family)